jgi:DNA topoisomerase-3
MKLIIAEKPSVERSIAHALGVTERMPNKYDIEVYKNEEYIVASALGHLYGFGMPEDYGYTANDWRLTELPMFPDLAVKPIMADEARYNKQRSLLRDLMNSPPLRKLSVRQTRGVRVS